MFKKINKYRSRIRKQKLLKSTNLPETGSVLDVSCGDGTFISLLHNRYPQLQLHGTDINQELITTAGLAYPFAKFTTSDSQLLPFPNEEFNVIFCNMAFHHYVNLDKTIREFSRVLKNAGSLYVVDIIPENSFIQRIYNFFGCHEPYHFEKFYTVNELNNLGNNYGLTLTSQNKLSLLPKVLLLHFIKN